MSREALRTRSRSLKDICTTPELCYLAKAGWVWKRARVTRQWLRRWATVRKGILRYCEGPGMAHDSGGRVLSGHIVCAEALKEGTSTNGLLMYGFMVTDNTGKTKKLWCPSQQACQDWCSFLSQWAQKQVLLTHWYHVQWNKLLGCGAFANVVKATGKSDHRPYAVKVVTRSAYRNYYHMMNQEVAIMSMLEEHPHLIRLKQVLYAPQRLYLITEYLDGGELSKRVSAGSPLSEADAGRITRQLLTALAALHQQRLCHMDIKPENIMFENMSSTSPIKLIDFSLACFFFEPTEPGGTPEFMAPELVSDPDGMAASGWGPEVDMWAVGILVFWMLCGRTPFDDDNIPQILQNILQGRWAFSDEVWAAVSDDAKTLIRSLLRRNASRRPSALALLQDPWVLQGHTAMPTAAIPIAGVVLKLGGGKGGLVREESGVGHQGLLLGTAPQFSRSLSYLEGPVSGLSSSKRTASATSIGPRGDPSHFGSLSIQQSAASASPFSQATNSYAHSCQPSNDSIPSPAVPSPQVWDNTVPVTKDLDLMAAIPEPHPMAEPPTPSHSYRGRLTDRLSPTYSVTATCSHSSTAATTASAASDVSHSITQPAVATAPPFMKRIRVTSKPKADVSKASQSTWYTSARSGQQAVVADGPKAAATEESAPGLAQLSSQQAMPQGRTSTGALNSPAAQAAPDSSCSARATDVQQMSHTPLYSFSQTFQHDITLTHGHWRGSGSPMPQRAFSEQPLTSGGQQTHAGSPATCNPSTTWTDEGSEACRSIAGSGVSTTHRLADVACQASGESSVGGRRQAEDRSVARSQQLSAQPQELSAQPQELSAQPQELSAQPQELSAQPREPSAQPQQLTEGSQQLSFQSHQLSNLPQLHSQSADQFGSSQQVAASGGSAGGSVGSFRGSSGRQLQGEDSECRAGRGKGRHQQSSQSERQDGAAMVVREEDDWCEIPASPRWWENFAKTDVIGMKELQSVRVRKMTCKAFVRAQKSRHLERMVMEARAAHMLSSLKQNSE